MMKNIIKSCAQSSLILFLIGTFLFHTKPLSAQNNLKGVLQDEFSQPLEYANAILLMAKDSSLYRGVMTNEKGEFEFSNIESNEYLLEISMIGFVTYNSGIVVSNEDINLGTLELIEDAAIIDGVVVTARKALYEKKADRTVINVQTNAINKGNTVLNVLRTSPGLMVSNDEIIMAGKQGVRIMLNDKLVRMPLEGVMQMLEGMSASNVESIELITNPGARYEAEGNAGFINIVLLDSPDKGWIANVGATIGVNQNINTGANGGVQYRGEKLSINANYAFNYNKNQHIWNVYQSNNVENFLSFSDSRTSRVSEIQGQNLNLGLTYSLAPKTEISFSLTGVQSLNRQNDSNNAILVLAPDSTLNLSSNIVEPNSWLNGSMSLGINHDISKKSRVKIFYDHLRYQNRQIADYDLEFTSNNSTETIGSNLKTIKKTPIRFHVFSADYDINPSSKFSFSTGARVALSTFANEVTVDLTGFPIYDITSIEPKTFLDEDIAAAYSQFTYNATSKLSIDGGLRYEHTLTDIRDGFQESVVTRNYGNWFPSVSISYKLKENTSLQLVYNRRITRPTFNDLAPFVFFQNPSTLVQGNSQLLPAIMDAVDFTINKGKYWVTFQYARTNNFISFFTPEINESSNVTYSTQNLDFMQLLGINVNANLQFSSWWSANNSLSFQNFNIEDVRAQQNIMRTVNNLLLNSNHSLKLGNKLSANVGFNYNHRGFIGLVDFKPQWMLNAGFSKKLSNGSQLSLRFTDIFASYIWSGEFKYENATQGFLFDQNLRAVDLTWSMSFGNKKLRNVNVENGSENERRRVN